jgi:hypothetical protein
MEERALKPLEGKAVEYAGIRDQRMKLSITEAALKAELLALMKQAKRREYVHDGIEISVVTEQETVKVRIKREDHDEEAQPQVDQ